MENNEKNYKKWMKLKSSIHNKNIIRSVKEGDIWWAAIGENVGVEIDGKSEKYSRPVVVLKKHTNYASPVYHLRLRLTKVPGMYLLIFKTKPKQPY